jgi:hypothetical protein
MNNNISIGGWQDIISSPPPKHISLLCHAKYCGPHFKIQPGYYNGINFITFDRCVLPSVTHYAVINKDALPEGNELERIAESIIAIQEKDFEKKTLLKFLNWFVERKCRLLLEEKVFEIHGAYVEYDDLADIYLDGIDPLWKGHLKE